ncbi:hypothetical protein [Haladaptatus sp. DYF46]|uniref:hypothetical protein n=1 Tax=Haladaptatus sp. DYF46 TaxID=2886041 RepID=UPI001E3B39D6|nr:hypothetical protein [Haladaptatus sp. DYF46]
MTEPTRDGLDRRTFLLATTGVVGAGSAIGTVGATSDASTGSEADRDWSFSNGFIRPSEFVLEQGDTCVPLGIVTSDTPVEEFYDYRSSDTDLEGWYSAYGPATTFERAKSSVLYLYRGRQGTSLVFMHGKRGSEDGGAVTFRFSGLPEDGTWAVTDDQYDASTNYDTFVESDGGWQVDWTWAGDSYHGGGADGGAFRGLTRDDVVTIDPAFNEAARLYGQHVNRNYVGPVEGWYALAADSSGHRWQSLDMERPVVIRTGRCDGSGGTETTARKTTETAGTRTTTDPRTTETTVTTSSPKKTTGTTSETTRDTTTESGANGAGMQTTSPAGQDGLGVFTAVSGFVGAGLSLYRFREEE